MKIKNCPFCGMEPTVGEHAPKVNGKYQWMIACENPHCDFNPAAHGFVSSEYAIKAWNTRTNEKYNKCPKCGCRLSFGLSEDKWACTVCGLMSRDYYADTGKNDKE